MFAVTAARIDPDNPLAGLTLGERPDPVPRGWTTVTVRAAALNHHDLCTLRGVGSRGAAPDGARHRRRRARRGRQRGHRALGDRRWGPDETLDPNRSLLSEKYDGTFAERVAVPRRNLVPKPAALSFEEAACLPTAWLTAYRMLFDKAGLEPGSTVLVQGAGGGVATALILLGRAAGYRIWVTSRSEEKQARALELGAEQAFEPGAGCPSGSTR